MQPRLEKRQCHFCLEYKRVRWVSVKNTVICYQCAVHVVEELLLRHDGKIQEEEHEPKSHT